jgi:hypothetical protein
MGLGVLCACRFELRYFDPFLVLDEFSGELFDSVLLFFF